VAAAPGGSTAPAPSPGPVDAGPVDAGPVDAGPVVSSHAEAGVPGPGAEETGVDLDRDTLVLAWGDHVLKALPAKAKALFGGGYFVSVEGGVATFALPSGPHRDRCEELRTVVEEAIAANVGARVRLRLVVEGRPPSESTPRLAVDGSRPSFAGSSPTASGRYGEDEDFDPDDPGEPVEIESVAQARLLEVFPGAQEVSE
jgi:hypothetical protein